MGHRRKIAADCGEREKPFDLMKYLRGRYVNVDTAPINDNELDNWLTVFEEAWDAHTVWNIPWVPQRAKDFYGAWPPRRSTK